MVAGAGEQAPASVGVPPHGAGEEPGPTLIKSVAQLGVGPAP